MKYFFLHLLLLTCVCFQLQAQDMQFKVAISSDQLQPGDTLDFLASYTIGDRKLPPATFALTMLGPANKVWQMRWPLVAGKSEGSIVLPDSLPAGNYNLLFAVQPRFLKLFGELLFPDKVKTLKVVLTGENALETLMIKPAANRKFVIENVYAEGNVKMSFFHDNERENAPPLIKLDAWLDSSFTPAAYGIKQIAINTSGTSFTPQRLLKDSFFQNDFSAFYDGYAQKLAAKNMKLMSATAIYDSLYVPEAFKAVPAMSFDCTVDSIAQSKATVFELLQQKMPGMQVLVWGEASAVGDAESRRSALGVQLAYEAMVKWNDQWYRLYFKGLYSSTGMLVFPPSAFASVKVFNPPFFQMPGSKISFGTIAFFERRWPLEQPFPYNNDFMIKGYTPSLYLLPLQ